MIEDRKKIVLWVVLAVAALAALVFCGWTFQDMRRQKEQAEELEKKEQAVMNQILDLEDQIEEIESGRPQDGATVQIIFPDPDGRLYTEIFPQMQEQGYTGVLAISAFYAADTEQTLGMGQIGELLAAGWSLCYEWKLDTGMEHYDQWKAQWDASGIPSEAAIYFESGSWQPDLAPALAERGIQAVVHHGEFQSVVTADFSEVPCGLGAVGMKSAQPKIDLENAVSDRGNIAFTVGYAVDEELYDQESFQSMLSSLKVYQEAGKLTVMNPCAALDHHHNLASEQAAWDAANQAQINALNEEIQTLKKEL